MKSSGDVKDFDIWDRYDIKRYSELGDIDEIEPDTDYYVFIHGKQERFEPKKISMTGKELYRLLNNLYKCAQGFDYEETQPVTAYGVSGYLIIKNISYVDWIDEDTYWKEWF